VPASTSAARAIRLRDEECTAGRWSARMLPRWSGRRRARSLTLMRILHGTALSLLAAGLSCVAAQAPVKPKKPGASAPNVRIPIEKLVPDAVFEIPGNPDWIAVDEDVWVSNAPKGSVARLDPKTNKVAATIAVGKEPGCGLAAGFGSLWVPNCGDSTLSRIDLKSGAVTATIPI